MKQPSKILPIIPLRGLVNFPGMMLHFDAGREKTVAALENAMEADNTVFLVAQIDARQNELLVDNFHEVGTVAVIKQLLKLPGGSIRLLVEGLYRGKLVRCVNTEPFFEGEIETFEELQTDFSEAEALKRRVNEVFEEYIKISGKSLGEALLNISTLADASRFADTVAENVLVKAEDRQQILECIDPIERMIKLITMIQREIEIIKADKRISQEVRRQVEKSQKEYYLREQLKAIHNELGEGEQKELDELQSKIEAAELTSEARRKALYELSRLSRMPGGSHEGTVVRAYLDWILDLPWFAGTEDNLDTVNARKILDEDHYGLDKVKDRVVEYLAVRSLTKSMRGPILCFVGPPGVGKTSIASSIARAVGRNFVRMSLGGVRDEAEIRGHRRTYIGAIPGRIISAMKQAKTVNPVILLDEIDKLGNDFRGDPASALLEVLDGAQNFAFRDHYIELPYDLSKVMFITTANSTETIPRALLDRMEVIRVSSYTEDEKVRIAMRHILPKQLKEHGLSKSIVSINEFTMSEIIRNFTSEAGVRELERTIAAISRKAACEIAAGKKCVRITPLKLQSYLGVPKYHHDKLVGKDEIGVATGLAWTSVGGETLSIEATPMPGSGSLILTGQLGDVMKESAQAGVSYVRSHAEQYGIDRQFNKTTDIHIHVPAGATPKDGPSAGITMATAIISALSGMAVRGDVAMTGEVTLRGRVLPVGGLKEKLLAAQRAGIKTVIVPEDNRQDLTEIPENITKGMRVIYADKLETVLASALRYMPKKREADNAIVTLDRNAHESAGAVQ